MSIKYIEFEPEVEWVLTKKELIKFVLDYTTVKRAEDDYSGSLNQIAFRYVFYAVEDEIKRGCIRDKGELINQIKQYRRQYDMMPEQRG